MTRARERNAIKDRREWDRQTAVVLALKRRFGGIVYADPVKRTMSITLHPYGVRAAKTGFNSPVSYDAVKKRLFCHDTILARQILQTIQDADPVETPAGGDMGEPP